MEQEKKCIDLVADKFAEQEQEYKDARKWYDEYEEATEGEQIAMNVITKKNGDYFNEYDNYYEWVNDQFLGFDFVEPFTFGEDQKAGYWRLQISWGGPSSEFRIYVDSGDRIGSVEYWYMDWFDGAYVNVGEGSECFNICQDLIDIIRY
jgi:hypothetical protein